MPVKNSSARSWEIITGVRTKDVFLNCCYNISLSGDKIGPKYRRLLPAVYQEWDDPYMRSPQMFQKPKF